MIFFNLKIYSNFVFRQQNVCIKYTKIIVLLAVWVAFTGYLMTKDEKIIAKKQLSISEGSLKSN